MLLASVAKIQEELGFDAEMLNIAAAITGALHGAEAFLAAFLDTNFERDTVTDTFYVTSPTLYDGVISQTEFRLSNGLVQLIALAEFNGLNSWPSGFDISPGLILKSEKGVVVDTSTNYNRQFVQISYVKGFEADTEDAESYKVDQVPRWLKEAAKLYALVSLETHPALEQAGIRQDTRAMRNQLSGMLAPYRRYAPTALLPI
jgi:hypothetical protein